MIQTKKLLHFNSAPIFIRYSYNSIEMIDNIFTYYNLDSQTYEVKKKSTIQKDGLAHEHAKIFDISNDNLHVYPEKETKSVSIFKNDNGLKIISTVHLSEAASVVQFSNNSKILLIGSDNGNIWLYSVTLEKIIYKLSPRSDEISSIVFSQDDKLVAIASYDKRIEIYDTTNWNLISTFEVGSVTEDMIFSNDNLNLYCVQRDGNLIAFNLDEELLIYRNNLGENWLSVIAQYKSPNYAIVGARNNAFLIVDLKSGKVSKKEVLQHQGLNCVDFSEESLLMAFANGSIVVCDMLKNRDEALVALKMEDYIKVKQLINSNILLYLDGTIDKLHQRAEDVLKEIVTLIELGKIDEASKLSEPFLDNEVFNEKFLACMSQRGEIAQFVRAIEDKNFTAAYQLADKHHYIKELKKYQALEEFWHQSFGDAKNLIGKNPNDSAAKIEAKGKLQAFLHIPSKRESIKNLLENSIVFFQADALVKEKKIAQFFKLCEQYNFLEDTQIYNKVISISQILISNINKAVQQKDYNNALLIARRVLSFTPVRAEVSKQIEEIKVIEKFNNATHQNDIVKIFRLIEENKFLENLLEYKGLMNDFDTINDEAKKHAVLGDVRETLNIISDYGILNHVKDQVAFTLKLAYLNSIPLAAQKYSLDWKRTFINYIELYGKEHELKNIAEEHSVTTIYESIQYSADGRGYKNRAFKDEVVVF